VDHDLVQASHWSSAVLSAGCLRNGSTIVGCYFDDIAHTRQTDRQCILNCIFICSSWCACLYRIDGRLARGIEFYYFDKV
jgi:hypothetical protein